MQFSSSRRGSETGKYRTPTGSSFSFAWHYADWWESFATLALWLRIISGWISAFSLQGLFSDNVQAVAQGLSNLFFALSLKHQLSYRQYPTSNFSLNTEALVERQPLLNPSAAVSNKPKCQLNIGDALCIFLFIGYTVALCVQALGRRFVIELYYAHLACLAALQLAQVWFWYAVVTYKGKFRPSYSSRILLSVGVTLSLFNVLPPMVWQTELPGDCVLQWFSWIDVMLLLDATSMLFVFLFLMAEYRRLREVMLYRAYASLHQSISFKT
eukprot:TRINITY_DN11331_c0_g1_i4.p1 TRINITY_DN11331_c0_g1~~TRINITY_DN11331_c0_g1_i4.p1  ORF type:complete len:270 (+),score=11.80 TRINITY_DN11331_c0_g1_i4:189-998(+)